MIFLFAMKLNIFCLKCQFIIPAFNFGFAVPANTFPGLDFQNSDFKKRKFQHRFFLNKLKKTLIP